MLSRALQELWTTRRYVRRRPVKVEALPVWPESDEARYIRERQDRAQKRALSFLFGTHMSRLIRKPLLLLRAIALSIQIIATAFVYALTVTVWDTLKWINGFTPWGLLWRLAHPSDGKPA